MGKLVEGFESVLSPVGAAKRLHLLAPLGFPALGSQNRRGVLLWPAPKRHTRFTALPVHQDRQGDVESGVRT